jgi:hypothetical protein
MATKRCNKCGEEKNLDEFNKNVSTADGHERTCRECMKGIRAAARERRRKERHGTKGRRGQRRANRRNGGGTVNVFNNAETKIAPSDVLFLDPATIRSIKKSVATQIYAEFGEFLKERYA